MTDQLEAFVSGYGKPLVVLHGSPQDPKDLDGLCAVLAKHAEVHRIAMPGYGERAGESFDWSHANDTLRRYVDLLEQPWLLGFSGGARRVLDLATSGASLSGVLCIAGFAHLEPAMIEGLNQAADALEQGADLLEPLVVSWFSAEYSERNPEHCRQIIRSYLKAAKPAIIAADVRSLTSAPDLRDALKSLQVPLRVLVGELDAAIPKVLSEAVHEAAPNSELEIIEGAGHLLHHEERERVFEWAVKAITSS
ncbi:MAG: pimeloyl-ACP methyl ester carboxylesterase [Polyangiales bacterium]|jgi:pimeloyl-ACP methyl ester carboxylesterase